MARFRALAAGGGDFDSGGEHDAARPAGGPASREAGEPVLPPLFADIDIERYERLKKKTIREANHRFAKPAVETARRLVSRSAPCMARTDGERLSVAARYLVFEAERVGEFNYRTAFRRVNVNRYLDVMDPRWTPGSRKQMRTFLYVVARVVHPNEYPPSWAPAEEKALRTRAISPEKVRRLYIVATALPAVHSRRVLLQLDLCYGAGARPGDLKELRGHDIGEDSWNGEPVALVRLANRSGGFRTVPVADTDASRRLLAAAAERPDGYLMTFDGSTLGRNAANKAGEYLVRRGHEGFNTAELRHGWMLQLAQRVPAALLMQLADVKDLRVLAQQQDLLPSYGVQHAVVLIKETWQ